MGDFAAYDADQDYYIIQGTDLPHPAEEYDKETPAVIEGCDRDQLGPGTIVCKGMYWNKVGRAKRWYSPPSVVLERLFRVRYVVATGFEMKGHCDATNPFPTRLVSI